MITLAATNTIQAVAGTATALTCTISGLEVGTADTFKILDQRQLPTSVATLYTVPASTQTLVKTILLSNTTASPVTATFYVNGNAAANQIASLSVPANGEAVFDSDGWKTYDATGNLLTGAAMTLVGDVTGSGTSPITTTHGSVAGGTTHPGATFSVAGFETALEHLALNSMDGRTSSGTNPRVFRPGDFMVGNTFDPTGTADSTSSFSAMMTAFIAFNDRAIIALPPGVFKVAAGTLATFAASGAPGGVYGAGRGVTVLIPTGSTGDMVKLPSAVDGFALKDFAIYQTGSPNTAGSGINTNGADSVTIENMLFVNQFVDVLVSGQAITATTNSTINLSAVTPPFVAGDVGKSITGPGIPNGTTLATQSGSTGTLSASATTSVSNNPMVMGSSIKVSIQRALHSQSNGSANSVGILINNGPAGDTYIGPDVVMSNTGATRRRASVEILESGHYEINQANLTGSAQGILIDPPAAAIVGFGFHNQVLCDSCTVNGMTLNATTATSIIKNIKSVNSWYSGTTAGAGQAGVKTTGTGAGIINGVTFTNDRFLNNRTHGFEHTFGTDFRWDCCDMKGNSAAAANTSDALNIAAGVSNWSVLGGKFGGTDQAPTGGNQRWGIFIAVGASANCSIFAADLIGNTTGPLSNGSTSILDVQGVIGLPLAPSASIATQLVAGAATENYVTPAFVVPAGSLQVGSAYRCSILITNAATIQTLTVRGKFGTGGVIGDANILAQALGAGTANTGVAEILITYIVRSIGAAGVVHGTLTVLNVGTGGTSGTTGPTNVALSQFQGVGSTVNTTVQNFMGVTLASTVTNIVTVQRAVWEELAV